MVYPVIVAKACYYLLLTHFWEHQPGIPLCGEHLYHWSSEPHTRVHPSYNSHYLLFIAVSVNTGISYWHHQYINNGCQGEECKIQDS
jgi:hypothetical protein